jgi:hypothetical protein
MKNLAQLFRILIPVLLISLIKITDLYPQSPKWSWARSAGEAEIYQSVTDTLGNTIVLGTFTSASLKFGSFEVTGMSSGESVNLYLVKYNSTGRVLWAVSIFGSDGGTQLKPLKLAVNIRGEIIVMGTCEGTPDIQLNNATLKFNNQNTNVFIAKYFKTGRLLWANTVRTSGRGYPTSTGEDAVIDNSGIVYMTGHFNADTIKFTRFGVQYLLGDSAGARMFLVKYNPYGFVDWAKTNQSDITGTGNIYGRFLSVDNDQVYLAGDYNGNIAFIFGSDTLSVLGGENTFLVKYTSIGNFEWVRSYGGDLTDLPDQLKVDHEGNIYLVGIYNSPLIDFYGQIVTNSGPDYDVFVVKLDPAGNPMWAQNINTQLTSVKNIPGAETKINIDDENNFYIITEYMGVSVLSNDFVRPNAEVGTRDIVITKLNRDMGDFLWAQAGNCPGDNLINSAVFDRHGSIYLSGDVSINPLEYKDIDATNFIIADTTGIGNGGFYIIKINKEGNIHFARSKINAADNAMTGNSLSVDLFGNLFLTGTFVGTGTNLDNIPVTDPLNIGIYTAKFSYVTDISGNVINEVGEPVTSGYVKLFGFTRFQRSPLSDSVSIIGDGSYLFKDIPLGWYIIFAKPGAVDYPGLAQTYYPSAAHWDEALPILVTSTEPITGRDIIVNNITERTGDAVLGGEIFEADTTSVFKSSKSVLKKAIEDVDVILAGGRLKSDYEIIAIAQTDENGDFAFYDVADGIYTIIADIPGLPHEEMYEVEIIGGEYISNLNYLVGEEYLTKGEGGYTGIFEDNDKLTDNFKILPNPNNGSFHIYLEKITAGSSLNFEIFSLTGQSLYKGTIHNPETSNFVNIKNIAGGIYFIRTTIDGNQDLDKLIIR